MPGHDDPIARRFRAARAYSGKSKAQVGEDIERHEGHVGRYERGSWKKAPDGNILRGYARATGVPEWFMLEGWDGSSDAELRARASKLEAENAKLKAERDSRETAEDTPRRFSVPTIWTRAEDPGSVEAEVDAMADELERPIARPLRVVHTAAQQPRRRRGA